MSPDWSAKVEPVPYAKLDDPQTLNLYVYVQNRPLFKPDLDGHGCPGSPNCIIQGLEDTITNTFNGNGIKQSLSEAWVRAKSELGINGGKASTAGGNVEVAASLTAGNGSISTTGEKSISLFPGFAATVDISHVTKGAEPSSVSGSLGEGLVSVEVSKDKQTLHLGPQATVPDIKGGPNLAASETAASRAVDKVVSTVKG